MCSFSKEGEQEDGSLCGCAFASGEVCEEQSFASSMSDIIYRQQPRSPVPMRLLTLALMRNAFLIVLLLGLGEESLATPVTKCALLRSIEVKRPSIVIRGAYLGRVEVWAVPTGTGITPDEYSLVLQCKTKKCGRSKRDLAVSAVPARHTLAELREEKLRRGIFAAEKTFC